jgi:DNA (cytosine-5)-methyltransferase 1
VGGGAHQVVAVENDPGIAEVYSDLFPDDEVIVVDAHQYLLEHMNDFDFIWSSPPCPTHSQIRYNIGYKANRKYAKVAAVYPEMSLYQEIILLNYYYDGKWVVENTVPYYEPLIKGVKTGGHIWWSNFHIPAIEHGTRGHRDGTVESLTERKMINLAKYNIKDKRKLLRNAVEPDVGLKILEASQNQTMQGILL